MPSPSELTTWCSEGNLDGIRDFLENDFPLLPPEGRTAYCAHTSQPQQGSCTDAPCNEKLTQLAIAAAEADQVEIFAYLWDTYLASDGAGAEIPWAALKAAARHGSIPLAEAFYCRDPTCFTKAVLKAPNGRVLGGSQIKVALLHGHLNYIEFLLAHGADINAEFPDQSPVRAAVRCDDDDETVMKRIRFLVDRGAWVKGSGALTSAAGLGRLDAVAFLIENGADADDLEDESTEINRTNTSALLAAAESGHEPIVRLLVKHGADVSHRDDLGRSAVDLAESNGHARLAGLLRQA
ncbi:ankyrin repeat domain-containing protein [Aspergillus melleus]|uniref:ankyrin repeat domain-containing protein n=1 Tax=Aspergillus melleus TaxID=138277 RepID=UPI001E8DF75F|nr:uncharacterized protein LDX57_004253 [Aspergillus melleus]KAH8426518.1 hypothetical protein LDX57_004253 [Aspergillus melleus]